MAAKNQQQSDRPARKSYALGSQDGYLQVLAWEQGKADSYGAWKGMRIDRYTISDQPKLRSITAIVSCPSYEDYGQAEWQAKMLVKAYHPSLWKEIAMSFPLPEGGCEVHVKWNIFKPQSEQEG